MTDTVYQWQSGGGGLGRIVRTKYGVEVEGVDGCVLMMPLYSTLPVWVHRSHLSVYYGDN